MGITVGGTILQIEKKQKIWTVLETTNWITSVNDLTLKAKAAVQVRIKYVKEKPSET